MKLPTLKLLSELGGLSGNAGTNHPGMSDDDESEGAKNLRSILSKNEVIKKQGNNYNVYNKAGTKKLGTHPSRKKALAQLRAIEAQKHKK